MEKSAFSHDYRVLCRLLREYRDEAEITQVVLAKRLKLTQSEISKFERGERRIDLVQLRWWCRALDIDLAEFVAEFQGAVRRK